MSHGFGQGGNIYLRNMIDHAFDWASGKGLVRKNTQHGEQEARLVLSDDFLVKKEEGESTQQEINFAVEDARLH